MRTERRTARAPTLEEALENPPLPSSGLLRSKKSVSLHFKSQLVRLSVIIAEDISFGRRPCSMNNFTFHISAQLGLRKDYWQPVLGDD